MNELVKKTEAAKNVLESILHARSECEPWRHEIICKLSRCVEKVGDAIKLYEEAIVHYEEAIALQAPCNKQTEILGNRCMAEAMQFLSPDDV